MLKIEYIDINKIKAYDKNAKLHPDSQIEQIVKSIEQFGFNDPIAITGDTIVEGHGRLLSAIKLGMKEVPIIRLDHLTEAQRKMYTLAHNKLTMNTDFDLALLDEELIDLMEDFEITDFGFELDLGNDYDEEEADTVPEVEENPVIKLGDLIELGEHRLLCGDSTKEEDVAKLMDGKKNTLMFTSPPYSDMREYNGGKNIDVNNIVNFISSYSEYCTTQIINLGIKRQDGEIIQYWDEYIKKAKEAKYKMLSWNIWNREGLGGSIGNQTAMFPIWHEWIFVFGRNVLDIKKTIKNKNGGNITAGTNREKDGTNKKSKQRTVKEFGKMGTVTTCGLSNSNIHPAMFPVELPEKYIEAMTKSRDVVVDPFLGGGSTLIACENLSRKCYGMELDEKYAQVIIQRYCDYTSIDTIKINGEECSWNEYKEKTTN